ncbi:MAG: FliO/MopB family protein [Gammaproteobacteria bacterium]
MNKYIKIVNTLFLQIIMLSVSMSAYGEEVIKEPFSAEFGGPTINYGQITTATIFIIVIIIIALLLLKKTRFAVPPNQGLLEVVHSFPISQKEKLLIVRVGSDYLLLGSSVSGIRKIHTLDKEEVGKSMSENDTKKNEFTNIFVNLMSKNRHA